MTAKAIQKIIDEHVITRDEAIALNMGKLTTPYNNSELEMLFNVIQDMRKSSINYGLVKVRGGIEVWRTGMRMIEEE